MKTLLPYFQKYSIVVLFSATLLNGNAREKITDSGLLLTFDDRNMINWEKQIPLFEKYNAHVTFFIDHFDELTTEQLKSLHRLKQAGHSIGCHGLKHLKAAEYCEKYSVEKYLTDEIMPAVKLMEENGFSPSCFAYPYSNHNDITDNALLRYFRHFRSGCGITGTMGTTEKSFIKIEEIGTKNRLDGLSFHPKTKNEELVEQAKRALDRIKKNKEILVLYAHDIRDEGEKGPKNYITIEALEEILRYARNNHIQLYSFDELP